jgi:hypothetical protein
MMALVLGAPAENEALEHSQPKETLKTANSIGYGYGYGLYGGYPFGYGYHGLYGWGKRTGYTSLHINKGMHCYVAVSLKIL